jgi:hypothetical protein
MSDEKLVTVLALKDIAYSIELIRSRAMREVEKGIGLLETTLDGIKDERNQ